MDYYHPVSRETSYIINKYSYIYVIYGPRFSRRNNLTGFKNTYNYLRGGGFRI